MADIIQSLGRRDFVLKSALAMAAPALFSLSGCIKRPPLRLAVQPWSGYQFLLLAEQLEWLPNHLVTVEHTSGTAESFAAIRDGHVDAAALTLDEVIRLRALNIDVKVVMIFDVSVGADVLLARPEIASLAELKGKRIAIEGSALSKIMLYKILQLAALNPTDVAIVTVSENHVDAWNADRIDAIVTYEPSLSQLQNLGLVPLIDSRTLPLMIVDVLAIRSSARSDHSAALRAVTYAHFHALHHWHTNPIDTAYLLAPLMEISAPDVPHVYNGLDLPDLIANQNYLRAPAEQMYKSAKELMTLMVNAELLQQPVDLTNLFVGDYLPNRLER